MSAFASRAFTRRRGSKARRGLTLIELIVATGLLTLLLAALLRLLQQFMSLWEKSEQRRVQVEEASGASELLAVDFNALEPGPRGDLLAEWAFFDTDGDGIPETKWPRIRMVRHASRAEFARLQAGQDEKIQDEGLLEVIWTVLPAHGGALDKNSRAEGILLRGERIYGAPRGADISIFDPKYLSSAGVPRPGTTQEVTDGVLWIGMEFASQTSILDPLAANGGWKLGGELGDCLACWDAWGRNRPNSERHSWNDPSVFQAKARETPLLPRRARVEIEFERPKEFKLRTHLAHFLSAQDGGIEIDDGTRLPQDPGSFVLLDAEWMEITAITGGTAGVKRGARGTVPAPHEAGTLVHYGRTVVREIPIGVHRDVWGL
jgi:type II secretory pathway pseudopilin PulG